MTAGVCNGRLCGGEASGSGSGAAGAAPGGGQKLGEGIEYSMPTANKLDKATVDRFKVEDTGAGLDDLMSQLQGLQGGGK